MATYTITIAPSAPAGTINTALTESVWLGSTYFLSVFTTTGTVATTAALTAITNDPYTTGTNTQTQVTTTSLGTFTPLDRPMLIRLDYNRVLMFYSQTNKALNYDFYNSAETLTMNAMVLEVVSNDNSVVYSGTHVGYAGFMNWINAADASTYYTQPTATKAVTTTVHYTANSTLYTANVGHCWGYSNSSYLWLTANRVLPCMRDSHLYSAGGTNQTTQPVYCQLFDLQYASTSGTTGPGTLTITQRYKDAGTTYGSQQLDFYFNFAGPNDVPYVYLIPGTTKVCFGFVNADPTLGISHNGSASGAADPYITATISTNFLTGNSAYVADYTQSATTWTLSSTIAYRRGATLAPLDSTRFIEVNNQVCATGTTVYSRVYDSVALTWTNDIPVDYTLNSPANSANVLAFGTCNQITLLGNDFLILSVNNRNNALSYYGIYSLVGNTVLRSTSLGAVALAPLTFQRGFDAIIARTVNDPNTTSPYDFFGKSSNLGYTFLRYANPT